MYIIIHHNVLPVVVMLTYEWSDVLYVYIIHHRVPPGSGDVDV